MPVGGIFAPVVQPAVDTGGFAGAAAPPDVYAEPAPPPDTYVAQT